MAAKGPRPALRFIDRLVLLIAWLVTSGIVYVFGYYVGKGSPARQATGEERSVRLPVASTPPPEGQRPKEAKDYPSFYQSLPAGERPIDVARGTPVTAPPGGTPAGSAPAAAPTTIVRTTTLPSTTAAPRTTTTVTPVPTTIVRGAVTPPPPSPPPPTWPRTATTLPTATASGRTESTLPSTPRPPQVTPTTLARAATPPTTLVHTASTPPPTMPKSVSRGGFTVEASPTRSRSEADSLLQQLRRRGYDATIVQVERDGDTWYRLRVGRYATSQQATDAMRKLRDDEGITHVFVAQE
jgi:cell division protein FtsN